MSTAVETTKKKAPAKKTAGRISPIMNEQVQQELLNLIILGTPIRKAVTAVGITEKTFYTWMNRGMAERERLETIPNAKPDLTEGVYLQFLQSCERARSEAIAKKVAVIAQSGVNGDWRAAAWWLERQVPDEFGKTDRVEIGGTNGDTIKIQVEMGDLEDKIAKVLALRKR